MWAVRVKVVRVMFVSVAVEKVKMVKFADFRLANTIVVVPNMGAGRCLGPEGTGVSLGEVGEGGPGPQKSGEINSQRLARKGATWRRKKKEKRVGHNEEGPARTELAIFLEEDIYKCDYV
jgi:hypothetical protein